MRKLLALSLPLIVASAAFAGSPDTVVIGTLDKWKILDPAKAYDVMSCNLMQNTLIGLYGYRPGSTVPEPVLAKSVDISKDGKTYVFHLKKGFKFQNGEEITAYTLKRSWDRVFKLKGDPAFLLTDVVKSYKARDKYTFEVHLKYPFSPFLAVTAFTVAYPVPSVYPENSFFKGAKYPASGPLTIKKVKRDRYVYLTKNPKYFNFKDVKAKKILIRQYQNAQTIRLALERGDIDMTGSLNTLDVKDFMTNPSLKSRFNVYVAPSFVISYIVFNVKKAPFDDPRVRKAIAYLIDRDEIKKFAYNNILHENLYSLIPINMWGHKDVFNKKPSIEKALKLLAEAGYNRSHPLVINYWYPQGHYGADVDKEAQIIKSQLEKTGVIKVNLKTTEWPTYLDYMTKGILGMFRLGWAPDYVDPDDYIYPFMHSKADASLGSFYSNPKVDALIQKARSVKDKAEREKLYAEIQEYLWKDVPYIPLFQSEAAIVANKSVKGVTNDPIYPRYYLLHK
ncbi:ABC transporter substrate-binding protein [Desulfurobacterium sp.]